MRPAESIQQTVAAMQVPPFKATLMEAMPFIDFLFGNETEAGAFAASEGWAEKDLPAIAQRIAAFPKASGRRCRTVVITHGKEPTVVAHNGQARCRAPLLVREMWKEPAAAQGPWHLAA